MKTILKSFWYFVSYLSILLSILLMIIPSFLIYLLSLLFRIDIKNFCIEYDVKTEKELLS
jgi:hypothetical protein